MREGQYLEHIFRDNQRTILDLRNFFLKVRAALLISAIQFSCVYAAPCLAETAAGPAAAVEAAAPAEAPPAMSRRERLTLDFANGLYSRKMYDPALSEYRKFIRDNPGSAEIGSARFRAAD